MIMPAVRQFMDKESFHGFFQMNLPFLQLNPINQAERIRGERPRGEPINPINQTEFHGFLAAEWIFPKKHQNMPAVGEFTGFSATVHRIFQMTSNRPNLPNESYLRSRDSSKSKSSTVKEFTET